MSLVVAAVASYGSLSLIQGMMARAVSPTADAPTLNDRSQPSAASHTAATVAFAPAAMTALLQAQEQMDKNAPVTARVPTVIAINQLISQMIDAPPSAEPLPDAPMAVRRLETARQQLAQA